MIYISVICVFCPFKDILVSHVTSCDWFAVVVVVDDVYFQEYDNHTCCSSRSMLYIPHLYERNLSDSWPSGHLFCSMRITELFFSKDDTEMSIYQAKGLRFPWGFNLNLMLQYDQGCNTSEKKLKIFFVK